MRGPWGPLGGGLLGEIKIEKKTELIEKLAA